MRCSPLWLTHSTHLPDFAQWPYSFNQCPSTANQGPNPSVYPWNSPVTPQVCCSAPMPSLMRHAQHQCLPAAELTAKLPQQMFTACGAMGLPPGISPQDWGMSSTVGRGAPEIDIFEAT